MLRIAGCKAALVPIEVTTSSVTYDTSSYQDLATAGGVIVQQCISNATRAGGGWELAGNPPPICHPLLSEKQRLMPYL